MGLMMIGGIAPSSATHMTSQMPYKGIMTELTNESAKMGGMSIQEVRFTGVGRKAHDKHM